MPELVPIRYGRMLVSPFTFFRGAASVMAADLVGTPRSGVTVQLCGDAHLSNFGLFGSPERRMLFDINDFDETLPGPWEWDVKRLAASFEILGRDRGFSPADRRAIVMAGVREYRDRMRRAAGMSGLQAWYEHLEAGELLKLVRQEVAVKRVGRREARAQEDMVAKARSRDSTRVLADAPTSSTANSGSSPTRRSSSRSRTSPCPGTAWEDPAPIIKKLLASYRRTLGHQHHPLEEYRYVHAARKVVGVGSVGTRCYILLLVGRDNDDPLFLQVKEAQPSVLEPFLGAERVPEPWPTGRRRSAADAGGDRHLPRLAADHRYRRCDPRLLRAPVPRLEGQCRRRDHAGARRHPVLPHLWRDPWPCPRPLGGPHRHRLLPRQRACLRPCDRATSPPPMPTRTNATTPHSPPPSPRDGSSLRRTRSRSGTARLTPRARLQRSLVLDDEDGLAAFGHLLATFAAAGNEAALALAYTFADVFR